MRSYHRWIALVFGAFLLFMSLTGLLLALDDMTSPTALERHGAPPAPTAALPQDADRLVAAALQRAHDLGTGPLASVRLSMQGQRPRVELQPAGHGAPLLLDARSGERIAETPGIPAWRFGVHGWLEYLHRGAFAGWPGVIAVLLTGAALALLSVTGLAVYLDMFARRRRSGRRALFWH